jgi:hypothetical protein
MSREKEQEKKFTEYLDRLLAGGEIPDDPDMDGELRATLDFARKVAGLRRDPSAGYQARLRAEMLRKLEERARKAEEKKGGFRGIWRQPVWQGVMTAVFVVIIISILWRVGVFSPSITPTQTTTATQTTMTQTATTQPAQGIRLSFSVRTDKTEYRPGEEVEIILTMKNNEAVQITLEKLPPIISLMSTDNMKPVYTFTGGQETRTLAPNQTVEFDLVWNQQDFEGNPVTGRYYIELEDLVYQGMPVQLHLAQPVEFDIQSYR